MRNALFFIVGVLTLHACSGRSESRDASGGENAAPSAFEGVTLRDQRARTLERADLAGKVLLVNFMFTSCASVCPRQTRDLAELARALPEASRERVRFLSVSVDPENDTPRALARFALDHGADLPFWSFAVAAPEHTRTLVTRLGAFDAREPAPTPASHTTSAYLFDPAGRLVQRYAGMPLDRARLVREIEQLSRLHHARANP